MLLIELYLNIGERTPPELVATNCPVFIRASVPLPSKWVDLDMWDTARQEKHQSICVMFYHNADAVFVCYDRDAADALCH
jgi:GTPase SAR1 family protein